MGTGAITQYVDVAQLVLYAFWVFFFGLIYYLIREGHREGYPMDTDRGVITGWPIPSPKTYLLADGSEVSFPNDKAALRNYSAQPTSRGENSPIEPVGNPMLSGVGPGAWTERADVNELDYKGHPKIVPLRSLPEFNVSEKDHDPRGDTVYGADGEPAGTVTDLWLDTSETLFRYLEVSLSGSGKTVLLPIPFARITKRDGVKVHALYPHQFADVPSLKAPNNVTILEEEKIQAYYGAGMMYADQLRAEPLV